MADFTCALYLGMQHGSAALPPWSQLTTGKPAALTEPALARDVANQLAQLIGCEHAVLAPSTLHVVVDLFGMLGGLDIAVYVDAGTYPIMRWGIERLAARGVPVRMFPRHDAESLRRLLQRDAGMRLRPVVVTDGVCPALGQPAPITDYLAALDDYGGCLIMDDTQGLGIFGQAPTPWMPYGHGGGGTLRWHGVRDPRVWVVSSLAKAFGVPMAVLAASQHWIETFERRSQTRVHCSPPCAAALRAAEASLEVNRRYGNSLRRRLLDRVMYFRERLAAIGIPSHGNVFPVQTLVDAPELDIFKLHKALKRHGLAAVLHTSGRDRPPLLSFLLNARHEFDEIDQVIGIVGLERNRHLYRRPVKSDWK